MTIFITDKKVKCFCLGLNNFCPDSKVYSQNPGSFYFRLGAPCGGFLLANTWAPRHDDVRRKHGLCDEVIRRRHLDRHVADHAPGEQKVSGENKYNNKSSIDPSCPKWLLRPLQFAAWLAAGCLGLLISWLVSDYAAPELSNVGVMCSVLTILTIHRETGGNNHTGKSFHKKKLDLQSIGTSPEFPQTL